MEEHRDMFNFRKLSEIQYNGQIVRAFQHDGMLWFIAKDIGQLMGMSDIKKQVKNLPEDLRVYVNRPVIIDGELWVYVESTASPRNPLDVESTASPRKNEKLHSLSEKGVLELIARSRTNRSRAFRESLFERLLGQGQTAKRLVSQPPKEQLPQIQEKPEDIVVSLRTQFGSIDIVVKFTLQVSNEKAKEVRANVQQVIHKMM